MSIRYVLIHRTAPVCAQNISRQKNEKLSWTYSMGPINSRHIFMMTSSNGNIFRVTGSLCGEFTGSGEFPPHKGQWRGALMFSLICVWINGWVNNREASDLRRHRGHYDASVMFAVWIKDLSGIISVSFSLTRRHYSIWPTSSGDLP